MYHISTWDRCESFVIAALKSQNMKAKGTTAVLVEKMSTSNPVIEVIDLNVRHNS